MTDIEAKKIESFKDKLTFAVLDAEENEKRLLVYFEGIPVIDAIMDGVHITRVRLFTTLFIALYNEDWIIEDGLVYSKWPEAHWTNEFEKRRWLSCLAQTDVEFEALPVPLRMDDWADAITALLEEALANADVNAMKKCVLEKAFAEIKGSSKRLALAHHVRQRLREIHGLEGLKPLILNVRNRQIRAEPILISNSKVLLLAYTGRGNNSVPMGALWFDPENQQIQGDENLSIFFNYDELSDEFPFFIQEPFSFNYLRWYLDKYPAVCSYEHNADRKRQEPWFYFSGLQAWIDPHYFARELFNRFDWMMDMPDENKNGCFNLFKALALYLECKDHDERKDHAMSKFSLN